MAIDPTPDYYEILQISPNAQPETVHRVYRLHARRLHPDNSETGNATQFRLLSEAYQVIGDARSAPDTMSCTRSGNRNAGV